MTKIKIINAQIIGRLGLSEILISDEKIVKSFDSSVSQVKLIDVEGKLVLPGLINPHTHLDKAGLADEIINISGTVEEARKKMFEYKYYLSMEDIEERASRVIDESIRYGITAIRTHVDVDPVIQLRGIQAILNLRKKYKNKIDLQIVAFPQEGIEQSPGTYELMVEALKMGADVVGGHLSIVNDHRNHMEHVIQLAKTFIKPIDIHVDFNIDRDYSNKISFSDGIMYPRDLGVVWMADEVIQSHFNGLTVASHLCGLDNLSPEDSTNVINLLKKANISVIALPPGNLFLQGRSDNQKVRRGVTKVKELLNSGIKVSFGPDNIRDAFNPIGSPNMIFNAILTAYACHMTSSADFQEVFNMCTYTAAQIMQLPKYGLNDGCFADLVVLDQPTIIDALSYQANPLMVFKKGNILLNKINDVVSN